MGSKLIKGYCPYCKKKGVPLIKHLLDNDTNLIVFMCKDCHDKEHFPQGNQDKPDLPGALAKKQIVEIDESGHFGKQGGNWTYIERKRK
jgi:RNase P subunit RPR2